VLTWTEIVEWFWVWWGIILIVVKEDDVWSGVLYSWRRCSLERIRENVDGAWYRGNVDGAWYWVGVAGHIVVKVSGFVFRCMFSGRCIRCCSCDEVLEILNGLEFVWRCCGLTIDHLH
jgi:hypothetical protein